MLLFLALEDMLLTVTGPLNEGFFSWDSSPEFYLRFSMSQASKSMLGKFMSWTEKKLQRKKLLVIPNFVHSFILLGKVL